MVYICPGNTLDGKKNDILQRYHEMMAQYCQNKLIFTVYSVHCTALKTFSSTYLLQAEILFRFCFFFLNYQFLAAILKIMAPELSPNDFNHFSNVCFGFSNLKYL